MADYFVVTASEDGVDIRQYTKSELVKLLSDEDDVIACRMNNPGPYEEDGIFLDKLPNDFEYMGNDILIIKGTIVEPKAKEAVTVYEVD